VIGIADYNVSMKAAASAAVPREGWEEAFRKMAERGDDAFTDEVLTTFDEVEWSWGDETASAGAGRLRAGRRGRRRD